MATRDERAPESTGALRRVCVFCGSSFGRRPEYRAAARATAEVLVGAGTTIVYGGASVGLMTVVADTALALGGEVIGVLPRFLADVEIDHRGLSELHVVESMAERKALMAELSDGFWVLPGGLGTLEETFEMVVRSQVHLHHKPVGLLDVAGYFGHLRAFLDHAADEHLLRRENLELMLFDDDPDRLLGRMATWDPSVVAKWIDGGP